MKKINFLLILFFIFALGCEGIKNSMNKNGGLISDSAADYIVITYSGGVITNVFKLKDVKVESERQSDGWGWSNQSGKLSSDFINIGGDCDIIRNPTPEVWDNFKEYHLVTDGKTYEDYLN